jgi:hypothetical protein
VSIAGAVADTVAALSAAGIAASGDPRRVNPPGALVVPDAIEPFTKMCRADRIRLVVLLIARDSGEPTTYEALGELYALFLASSLAAAPISAAAEYTFERRVLPDSPAGLPALRLSVTRPLESL